MSDQTPPADPKPAEKPAKKTATPGLVVLTHERDVGSYPLSIGKAVYEVVDGRVEVAPEHVEAAHAAGFRPSLRGPE